MSEEKFSTWRGQIVNDIVWRDNLPATKWKASDEISGWGTRYKVRIIGRDTDVDIPDDQLEWATVLYPVTSGSGHKGSYQTPNLSKGSFVWGFYDDPDAKCNPIIVGCFGNNEQIKLAQSIPLKGFVPYSGYIKEKVSYNDIPAEGSPPPNGPNPLEGSNNQLQTPISDQIEKDDGNKETYLTVSTDCDKLQLGAIQVEIKKLIQEIQEYKKRINSWKYTLLKPISENGQEYSLSEYIDYKVQNVSKWVSGKVKNIVTDIEQHTTNKINNAAKDFYYDLFPNERPELKKKIETANDLLACLFRKIVGNLLKMITDVLKSIVERFINAPLCAVENIVSSLLGKLIGLISSAIENIIRPIEALVGGIFDVAGGVLGFITDLLSFLSCEENPECPGVTGWTPWKGATSFNVGSNVNDLIEKIQNVASNAQQIIDPDNFDFNLDFSDVLQDTCNVGPIFCGPPTVQFYGGGGSGASGNAIISAAGEILGVDIINGGSGYTSSPFITFVDNCGNGQGATATGIASTSTGTGGSIANVVITNPGTGYLPVPNGDRGGDGRVWATGCDATVKRRDGTYDRPYIPGENIQVNPGDEVYIQGTTTTITEPQIITVPECNEITLPRGENPSLSDGQYPIFLEIERIVIDNPGINYSPNDTITITPTNGAVLKPVFDNQGSLTKVDVIRPGIGFTSMPTIEIETETGYNASLLPVFKVNRLVGRQDYVVDQTQIISVIDCVGKFNG